MIKLWATAAPYKTYAIIDVKVYCSDLCSACSVPNTCDRCNSGYTLNPNLQCEESTSGGLTTSMASYISSAIGLTILAIGGLSLSISPNFWSFVNTL